MAKNYVEGLRQYYDRAIEATSPMVTGQDNPYFEIHLLLGSRHVGMCLWAVKSLLQSSGKRYSVVLHDDGSLADSDIEKLERHLIGVRVFRKPQADALIAGSIAGYNHVVQYRFNQLGKTDWGRRMSIFSLKLLDFNLLTEARKIMALDTDVLFFQRPDEIIAWVDDVDRHETLYCLEYYQPVLNSRSNLTGFVRKQGVPLGFNSGLICLDRSVVNLEVLDDWLKKNQERVDTTYTFEQHAYNYWVDYNDNHRPLPDTYSFNYNDAACAATHFGMKPLFFENLPRIKQLLDSRRHD